MVNSGNPSRIAERTFELKTASGPVAVHFSLEMPTDADGASSCAYVLSYLGTEHRVPVFGGDSMQALVLALSVGADELATVARRLGARPRSEEWRAFMKLRFRNR
jgi:hypothetical protein